MAEMFQLVFDMKLSTLGLLSSKRNTFRMLSVGGGFPAAKYTAHAKTECLPESLKPDQPSLPELVFTFQMFFNFWLG